MKVYVFQLFHRFQKNELMALACFLILTVPVVKASTKYEASTQIRLSHRLQKSLAAR